MRLSAKLSWLVLCTGLCLAMAPAHTQTASFLPAGSTGARACSGGDTGPVSPCGAGVASSGGTEVARGAGNPINVISGNKYQREDDLPALPGILGLEIVRHYNSLHSAPGSPNGILGRGWRLSYETALHVTGRALQITQADGTRLIFSRDPFLPSRCATADPADGTIDIRKTARGDEYVWTWRNGRRLDFDSDGRLVQILAPTGEFLTLDYNRRGWLSRVTDPQGRSLRLRYPAPGAAPGKRFGGVLAIDSPVGQFRYEHGSALPAGATLAPIHVLANLTAVVYPDGSARRYHHEDARHPTLLTGISGSDGQRIATYGYNGNGLAVMSMRGQPQPADGSGLEQVTLDFSAPGETILINSLGQQTIYRHAMIGGGLRLLEVRGTGCASCGEPNMRYGYDRLGRLTTTTRLDADGKALETQERDLDGYGRVTQVRRLTYRHGKPGQAQWLVRYDYQDSHPQPVRMARPSVVPGRQYQIRIDYNGHGQPTRIVESGWSPAIDRVEAAAPIERTTTYAYAGINGRSLLTRIDGPLPNGPGNSPADSDITQLEWDGKGNAVMQTSLPGGLRGTADYDAAGRLIEAGQPDGRKVQLSYNPRNHLAAITADGMTRRMHYDASGNAVETGDGNGPDYKALLRSGFDAAGRAVWRASHLGILQQHRYDSEGRLLETATQSAGIRQAQRFAYDPAGRLLAVTDAHSAIRRIRWNPDGLPQAMTDALGRETRYRHDEAGRLVAVTHAANTAHARWHNTTTRIAYDAAGRIAAVTAPNGAITRYVHDDFGRTLAVASADGGTATQSFDAADRLVAGTDANGNQAHYEYDAGGRLVKQTVLEAGAPGAPRNATVTRWTYEGARLVALEHPEQAERYRYDGQGRLATRTVTLMPQGAARSTSVTHYRYDAAGRLAALSLPDGSMLHYRRNGQHQVTAIERSLVRTPWLSWLAPAQPLVTELRRDLAGVKSYAYGNGIAAHYQRSAEGALAAITYRHADARATESRHPAAPGLLPGALIDRRYLWDVQGNLLRTHDTDAIHDYAYDAQDRLIAMAAAPSGPANAIDAAARAPWRYARYFHDGAGNRLLSQEGMANQADLRSGTVRPTYGASSSRVQGPGESAYDPGGQPVRLGRQEYAWDGFGRLREVRQATQLVAAYRYNHRGERIAKQANRQRTTFLYEDAKLSAELDEQGRIARQYVYLGDQPIALIDTPEGTVPAGEPASALRQIVADIGAVFKAWLAGGGRIAYLHNNHLGATELITDGQGKPLWQAAYSPYGKIVGHAASRSAAFPFRLRLPGQYEDEETGLYYNRHRYYDPAQGRYLTPDPLGLRGGINSYAYAQSNPLKYIDPTGLILFAFDGTNNSNPPPGVDDFSNVYKFYLAYDDGKKWYMNGVGRDDPDSGIHTNWFDEKDANTARARVDYMLGQLDNYMTNTTFRNGQLVDIDIVGFSRGAAMSRDFTNRVATRLSRNAYKDSGACAHIRFLGLWDTVAQFGANGWNNGSWKMAIPAEVQHVFQAVALNEHRYLFPGESIGRGVQKGFIGSHADIGGSYGTGDLSDVTLNWIVEQAKASGVKMKTWLDAGNEEWGKVTNPALHDKSSGSDRDFCLRANNEAVVTNCRKQRQAMPGGMTWSQTQMGNYIDRYAHSTLDADGSSKIVGEVNMKEYAAWLRQNYGLDISYSMP